MDSRTILFVLLVLAAMSFTCSRPRGTTRAVRQPTYDVGGAEPLELSTRVPSSSIVQEDYLRSTRDVLCRVSAGRIKCILRNDLAAHFEGRAGLLTAESSLNDYVSCVGDRSTCLHLGRVRRDLASTSRGTATTSGRQTNVVRHAYTDTHECTASSSVVSCTGSSQFGAIGLPDGAERHLTRMDSMIPSSLAVWTHATCIGQERGSVWCWGAFGNPSERVRQPSHVGIQTPELVGQIRGLQRVAITECGVCALGTGTIRCWRSRDHRIANATPTAEAEVRGVIDLVYDEGNDVLCLAGTSFVQCAGASAGRGCTSDVVEAASSPLLPLPEGAHSLLHTSGYLCMLDRTNHTICADTQPLLAGGPLSWMAIDL